MVGPTPAYRMSTSEDGAGSYEALQDKLFGPGASSNGALPPGINREAFHADARKLQRRLNRMWAGLINPNSKAMEKWDLVIIAAMLYTAFVTPAELFFGMLRVEPGFDSLFWCNQVVNVVFWIDIGLQFFIPIKGSDGLTIRAHRRIAWFYMTGGNKWSLPLGWLPLDVVSVLPLDIVEAAGGFAAAAASGNDAVVQAVRLTRLLKLLKLLRVLKASRVLARFQTRTALTYTSSEMVKYTLIIIVTLHWLACMWAGLATFQGTLRTNDLELEVQRRQLLVGVEGCLGCSASDAGDEPQCVQECLTSCEVELLAELHGVSNSLLVYNRQHWLCRASDSGQIPSDWRTGSASAFAELYFFCLLVALGQLSGGAISTAPQNLPETLLFLFALLAGSVIWAIVQGTICGIITVGDPHYIQHRQNIDQLNFLMGDMGVSQDIKVRVREYYGGTLSLLRRQSYGDTLDLLSPMLMTDVTMRMASWVMSSVEWMRACEPDFLRDLFRCMARESYAVKERIDAGRLNVLNVGVVARGGKFLVPLADRGPTWGDILLTAPALRDMAPARALTYVEVTTLTRDDLDTVCANYPVSAAEVRRSAMTSAMVKATELINASVARSKAKQARAHETADEAKARERQAMLLGAMGGTAPMDDSEADDPDEVLRMICGAGGMKYRQIDSKTGEIVEGEGEDGNGGNESALEKLLGEVRAMREEQQAEALWMHSRIERLEGREGLVRRDSKALMARPAVQRALRLCAALQPALRMWRSQAARSRTVHDSLVRLSFKQLFLGWNTWLGFTVQSMHLRQLLARAKYARVFRALHKWQDSTMQCTGAM